MPNAGPGQSLHVAARYLFGSPDRHGSHDLPSARVVDHFQRIARRAGEARLDADQPAGE
jgi:hypothetical protein